LYIADATADGGLADVTRQLRFVRLGEGVDASGRFQPEALQRLFVAVDEYAQIIAQAKVDKVRFVATSAARDASNREDFFAGVRQRLGVEADIIGGDEEARLSFLGALAGGPLPSASGSSVLVTDLGGGSTELIRGDDSGQIEAETSLDMGSVRLRERFLHHDPPLDDEVEAARQFVADLLAASPVPLDQVDCWIGVAGTCTSLSAMNLGLTTYDRATVHDSTVTVAQLEDLSTGLLTLSVAQTMAAYPSLQPRRAEVICAGALICAELARRIDRPLLVRDTDILDGTALELVRS
jgi:exopolyphosphatase/guanosine-5'-triphosphate,3'-diphosphate pyrophosphatase